MPMCTSRTLFSSSLPASSKLRSHVHRAHGPSTKRWEGASGLGAMHDIWRQEFKKCTKYGCPRGHVSCKRDVRTFESVLSLPSQCTENDFAV